MQGLEERCCLICQTVVGSSELTFWGSFICSDCEGEIMELAADQPKYAEIVNAFRLLWQSKLNNSKCHTHTTTEGEFF